VRELDAYMWMYFNLLGLVLVLSVFFYVLERFAPAEKGQSSSKWLFNIAYFHFILASIFLLQFLFNPVYSYLLILAGGGLLPKLISQPTGFVTHLLFGLGFALVWDLWQYWIHRLQHTHILLWETHKFHHSETALNSSTVARHHILNHILFLALYPPVLLLFGSLTPHFIATFVMFRLWGFVNHMNVRLNFGGLTTIISGPQWHRIHHSVYREHQDKNFAAFFPFIDILFGTYYRPRKDEYPATGLMPEDHQCELYRATVAPLLNIYKIAANRVISVLGGVLL
jgi:sterol desaturase/sphingolipid hydroxylase (fatty acid hydroxylase superfamily)